MRLALLATLLILVFSCHSPVEEEEMKELPNDWFFTQRAYPFEEVNYDLYIEELHRIHEEEKDLVELRSDEIAWELVGPTNIGGRVTDVAINPNNPNIIFAGTASGGVFKTTDRGYNWKPVFDKAGSLSTGDLAIAPSNPRVLYVGTGEANGSAASGAFAGDGMYKSTDGGRSWKHIGLDHSYHIGRVVVNPKDENHVLVAVAGLLYGKNEERGLYETKDGGQTWQNILFVSDSTSCIDVVIHPTNPNIIYAATWERIRKPWERDYGGKTSRIYRSKDGGATWEHLTNGLPPSDENRGRIGIAIAPSDPDVLYTCFTTDPIENSFDGVYKTIDGGDNWQRTDDFFLGGMYSGFGWYFGKIRVDPNNPDIVYVLGINLMRSEDGGNSWKRANFNVHVDQHGLDFFPDSSNIMVLGNDGGLYVSDDNAQNWRHSKTLPITQFYECEVSQAQLDHYFGGTQDNGTVMSDHGMWGNWRRILGGDGFHVIVDPEFPEIVYAEYQWGNLFRSNDGGNTFQWARSGIDNEDRNNWNTPIELDPNNTSVLYYGSSRLYRSTNRAGEWTAISDDLTQGQHPSGSSKYGTITAIEVSPANSAIIWVGTDDGNVQVTLDGGTNWNLVSSQLPIRYISSIAADVTNPLKAYVTLSGYRRIDALPHVFLTEDGGQTWQPISNNLPEVPVNEIIIDEAYPDQIYVATDLGVWHSTAPTFNWERLGKNLPLTVITDLVIHQTTRTLIAATYGRSMHKFQLDAAPPTFPEIEFTYAPFSISPNPVQSVAQIKFQKQITIPTQLKIFDISGQLIHQTQLLKNSKQLQLPSNIWTRDGLYFAQIVSDTNTTTQSFFVVR